MEHNVEVLDHFTRQAGRFARAASSNDKDLLDRILRASHCGPGDVTLDVACGPGIVVCAFARVARHATGIDLTPAMLDEARRVQADAKLANITWDLGDITRLPYKDASYDIVTCRFAFHHLLDPLAALREMVRVCRVGGRVVVADSSPDAARAEGFDNLERLRDPSHTHALPPGEMTALFASAGLTNVEVESMRLDTDIDALLGHSVLPKENIPRIHALFDQAMQNDLLDMAPVRRDGKVYLSFPVSIFAVEKRA